MGEKNNRLDRGQRVRESKQAVIRSVKAGGAIHDALTLLALPHTTAVASILLHAPRHPFCFKAWMSIFKPDADWDNGVYTPTRMIPAPLHKRCAQCGGEFRVHDHDDS